jgi:AcrR family transcriptional regulator
MVEARIERKRIHEAENRRDILRAAERLILRRGFGRLTMDDIGREAQFSKATLYKYFSSKTEVVLSIFTAFFDRIANRFSDICRQDLDASTKLKRIIHSSLKVHHDSRNISQALLLDEAFMKKVGLFLAAAGQASSAEDRKLNQLLHSRVHRLNRLIGEFLAEGVRSGEFRPMNIPLAVSFLGAAISGFSHQKSWLLTRRDITRETEFIHDLFLHGLARPGEFKKGEQR